MDRSNSGELLEQMAKRKSPLSGSTQSGACAGPRTGAAAPKSLQQPLQQQPLHCPERAPCSLVSTPALSSPAFGGWSRHNGGTAGDDKQAGDSCESCDHTTAESARGKTLRVCSGVSVAAAAGDTACPGAESGRARPSSCHDAAAFGCSLPPGMYRSYHLDCCSRLNSSSSLTDLDASAEAAAAAAAVIAEGGNGQAGTAASPPPAAAPPATATAAPAPLAAAAAAAAGAAGAAAAAIGSSAAAPSAAAAQAGQVTAAGLAVAAASRPEQGSWPPPSPFGCACAGACYLPCQEAEEAGGEEPSYWHDIPDDILKRVLERLQPSTLRVLRLVCRGWEAAASRLLRHLRPETICSKHLATRFPSLRSLDLSSASMGVDFASPRSLRLQSLLLDDHLAELAGLTRLEQLSLRGCTLISGLGLAQLGRLSALAMLNLSNCAGVTDECLAALAAAAPQLGTLNLQGCSRLGDDGVAHLVAMPRLRHVLLPAGISDACMASLVDMPALERVALRGCSGVTTAGIYVLLQRRGLKRVVISKCPHISLEALCSGGEERNLKVVSETGAPPQSITAVAAALLAAGAQAALGVPAVVGAPGMAGPDMQLLVGDV